jgi:hypothetical protein
MVIHADPKPGGTLRSQKVEILNEKYTNRKVKGPDKRQGKKLIKQEKLRIRNKKETDQQGVEDKGLKYGPQIFYKKTQIKNDKNLTNEEDKRLGAREEIDKTTGKTKMRQQERKMKQTTEDKKEPNGSDSRSDKDRQPVLWIRIHWIRIQIQHFK